jgi:hypothetical protein
MSNKSDNFLANMFLFGTMLIMISLLAPACVKIKSDAQAEIWLYTIGIGVLCLLIPFLFMRRNK